MEYTTSRLAQTFLVKKLFFVVWEDVGVPFGIVGIEVGKNMGNKL